MVPKLFVLKIYTNICWKIEVNWMSIMPQHRFIFVRVKNGCWKQVWGCHLGSNGPIYIFDFSFWYIIVFFIGVIAVVVFFRYLEKFLFFSFFLSYFYLFIYLLYFILFHCFYFHFFYQQQWSTILQSCIVW